MEAQAQTELHLERISLSQVRITKVNMKIQGDERETVSHCWHRHRNTWLLMLCSIHGEEQERTKHIKMSLDQTVHSKKRISFRHKQGHQTPATICIFFKVQ